MSAQPDTSKRAVLKRLRLARDRVAAEITGHSAGKTGDELKYAGGLASEGYAGGYRQALDDVEAALLHGWPTDPRRYWTQP